jgi:hypothetical protein
MSGTLKEAVIAAADAVGEKRLNDKTGEYESGGGGLAGYLLHLALHNESAFCALLARVLPLHKVEEKPKRTYPTEEEVRALCAKHGIPFESVFDDPRYRAGDAPPESDAGSSNR